jgi:hypothetical protein
MKISNIELISGWENALSAARTTSWKQPLNKQPSLKWRKQILLAEHSVIRTVIYQWQWIDLPYYVSTHIARHKIGIEHFVSSQREDRSPHGLSRHELRQDEPVVHRCMANAQEIISISRKRLCAKAYPETRHAWRLLLSSLPEVDPELPSCCVPECVYRGFCPEMDGCKFSESNYFADAVKKYRNIE